MTPTAFWWILAALAVGAELITGTFYLLFIALGFTSAALVSYLTANGAVQMGTAALIGGACVWMLYIWRKKNPRPKAACDENVNPDINSLLTVNEWNENREGNARYRGAMWAVEMQSGFPLQTGICKIVEVQGNCLIVEPVSKSTTNSNENHF